jgi:hypothetical protein
MDKSPHGLINHRQGLHLELHPAARVALRMHGLQQLQSFSFLVHHQCQSWHLHTRDAVA